MLSEAEKTKLNQLCTNLGKVEGLIKNAFSQDELDKITDEIGLIMDNISTLLASRSNSEIIKKVAAIHQSLEMPCLQNDTLSSIVKEIKEALPLANQANNVNGNFAFFGFNNNNNNNNNHDYADPQQPPAGVPSPL